MIGTKPGLIRKRCPSSRLMKAATSSYGLFMAMTITDQQTDGTRKNKGIVERRFKLQNPYFVKPHHVIEIHFVFTSDLYPQQIAHEGSSKPAP